MSQRICFSTLLSILMLLVGCSVHSNYSTGLAVTQPEGENPVVTRVASIEIFDALLPAIERHDRKRLLAAGFNQEQVALLLDPATSGAFLAPYREAAVRGYTVHLEGGRCHAMVRGGAFKQRMPQVLEACRQL